MEISESHGITKEEVKMTWTLLHHLFEKPLKHR